MRADPADVKAVTQIKNERTLQIQAIHAAITE
jgi:hypothetical protein